jgi:CDP-6-deoxy-D-xylo-4-hexulose-3-dehydrase
MIRYGGVISGQAELDAVQDVMASGNWACGVKTAEFESESALWQGRSHALFVNSGSSALLLALSALPPKSRVAMPALQFATLYSAAKWCGHEPVLVDIDDSLNMDPRALLNTIADNAVDAVAFVHMAGNPSNAARIAWICENHGLPLIEDTCEALGAVMGGKLAGNFGLASATSTHGAHHISTGEGGIVFTDDDHAYAKMRSIRDWGRAYGTTGLDGYYHGYVFSELGLNLHATDIQAAIGIVQLTRLDGFIIDRKANWKRLAELTRKLPFTTPLVSDDAEPSWYTFPMLVETSRNELISHLAANGVESRPIVAGNMARQPMSPGNPSDFPVADKWFHRGLWVSVHPQLTTHALTTIADVLEKFWRNP